MNELRTTDNRRQTTDDAPITAAQAQPNPKSEIRNPKSVTVVIPTYNSIGMLRNCLDSLRDIDYPKEKMHVVVVDNASKDGTAETLRLRYPHVTVSIQEENTGFAAACNKGAALAETEYVAFLNDDAIAETGWLRGLFAGLDAGGEGAVCAASQIRSRDGQKVEYEGASSNLFGAGRPVSVWGWPDLPEPPGEGSPVLFASGGAMLIHRKTFLDVGGFDPEYFAYFEDVDLGWRLWVLGYRVVYAPQAVVRHVGGATGSRSPVHRRYTLWECNSLATILKNYETGNMERVLSAALMLQYRRALMASGDAVRKESYALTGPPDSNSTNVERLPRVSVAHLAAIDRLNSLMPHFMEERRRIQAARVRPDSEILPLLGHAWQPQFAGSEYAEAARKLASDLGLYALTNTTSPNRVLLLATTEEAADAESLAAQLAMSGTLLVAVAIASSSPVGAVREPPSRATRHQPDFTRHSLSPNDPILTQLTHHADAILLYPGVSSLPILRGSIAAVKSVDGAGVAELLSFCLDPVAKG
ncbi:MAG TPA: glycosyltransferase family 2 protein [Chloroflexia bacterium]|nr:glycosyltransferase family 2 protein [Chloroflexia bacterium]